jgi:predicted transcriptional regulator
VSNFRRHEVAPTWMRMSLGPLEWQVMASVWQLKECSVHDVVRALPRKRAYTTVMTTIDRLYQKKILRRKKADRRFLYSARLDRQQVDEYFAQQLLGRLRSLPETTRKSVISCLVEGLT